MLQIRLNELTELLVLQTKVGGLPMQLRLNVLPRSLFDVALP